MTKIILRHYILKTIAMFVFTRFYLRVLADLNEIIRRLKRNVILRITIIAGCGLFVAPLLVTPSVISVPTPDTRPLIPVH